MSRIERLDGHVQNYVWGKRGRESEVARLYVAGHPDAGGISPAATYAELWAGTHPDGPARVRRAGGELLSQSIARVINNNNSIVKLEPLHRGKNGQTGENGNWQIPEHIHLPFIMKIMSIQHTLSLQVHPNKEQAAALHKSDPVNYPDANHKPELAYALTRFELLCGFRPAREIVASMNAFPELCAMVGESRARRFRTLEAAEAGQQRNKSDSPSSDDEKEEELKNALRDCFTAMLQQQVDCPEFVLKQLSGLYGRLANGTRGCLTERTVEVMWDNYKRFPTDSGCFAPLLLNHMVLEPGECCFYGTQELHAYLSGECVECVGCSNNTIRAGLTPKFVDRQNLVRVLNYRMTDPAYYDVPGQQLPDYPHVTEFAPDCKDFTLQRIQIDEYNMENEHSITTKCYDVPALGCPSIVIVTEGEATPFADISADQSRSLSAEDTRASFLAQRGDIFFIPPHRVLRLVLHQGPQKQQQQFIAFRTSSYEAGPAHEQLAKRGTHITPATLNNINNDKADEEALPFPYKKSSRNKMEKASKLLEENEENKTKAKTIELLSPEGKTTVDGLDIFDVALEMDGFL